jgi:tetratricopeptide (TPR) repeat protein
MFTHSRDSQRQGVTLYQQGNYADAAGAFRNAVRQNPREYQSYYYLGACYESMRQYQQAIQAYKQGRAAQATSLAGRDDAVFRSKLVNGLASAIAKSDQRDVETDAAVQRANTKSDPSDWFLLARIYTYRGDADSAMDAYNRACLLDSHNFAYAKEYGLYLEKIGQPRLAETPLRRAYSLNPTDDQVVLALRRIGVIPGPSLREESALAKPAVPKGPIPEVELDKLRFGGNDPSPATPGADGGPRD